MKISTLTLLEIKKILKTEKEFKNIDSWNFKHTDLGEMLHKYKVSKGKKVYFVKEVKPHEAQMEYFLAKLRLKNLPYAVYPNLLKQKILVRFYIPGKMLKNKNVDLELLKNFALMRNRLADKKYFDRHNFLKLHNYSRKDDGFYTRGLSENFKFASKRLKYLQKYNLEIVDKYLELFNYLNENKDKILKEFGEMPLAKQHQDFREDNIIVMPNKKQALIDWGSSYGYNPFMYDVSPFIIKNIQAKKIYLKFDNICKKLTKEQINRWIYIGLVARFFDIIRWRLDPSEKRADTKEHCKKYLEYEWKTYKYLLSKSNSRGKC